MYRMTTMEGMFSRASAFNQPLKGWTLKDNVIITHMFRNASSYTYDKPQPGQIGVRPTQIIPTGYRFTSKDELNKAVNEWCQKPRPTSVQQYGHISTWDVSQITDMSSLFRRKTKFNDNISEWDVRNVTNMQEMLLVPLRSTNV